MPPVRRIPKVRVKKGREMTYTSVVSVAREERESGSDVSGGLRAEGHMWWVWEGSG